MGNIDKNLIGDLTKQFAGTMSQLKLPSISKIGSALNSPQTRSLNTDLGLAKGSLKTGFDSVGGWKGLAADGTSAVGEMGKNSLKEMGGMNLAGLGVSLAGAAVGKADYGGGMNKLLTGAGSLIGGPAGLALQAASVVNNALGSTSGKTGDVRSVVANTGTGFVGASQLYSESKNRDENKKTTLLGNLSGKKRTLSTSSNNARIQENINTQARVNSIGEANKKAMLSADYNTANRDSQYQNKMSGNNNKYIITARLGTKLPNLNKSLIPEGALHARKHNIKLSGEITTKGIPVVSYEEGGDIKQHAEIEVNEIVLRKKATVYLENLEKQYSETEDKDKRAKLAIKAGKYFEEELMENTNDNTGLIETV